MITYLIVTSGIVAVVALVSVIWMVIIGYLDGYLNSSEKTVLRVGVVALVLSPVAGLLVPIGIIGFLGWALYKLFKGVIVYGFSEPENEKEVSNSGGPSV